MLIVVQERNWTVNSKDIEYVYIGKYYYKDNEEYTTYKPAGYVEEHLDEYPDINEYKIIWMIRTNWYGWQELGRYNSEESANKAMDKLLNNKSPKFYMPKDN